MKYYLRFGDIPTSGLSNIWLNDQIIGQELGVFVYDAVLMTNGEPLLKDPHILLEITKDFWKNN